MVKQKDLTTCITCTHASHRRRLTTKPELKFFFSSIATASLLGRCLSLLPLNYIPSLNLYKYRNLLAYSQLPHLSLKLQLNPLTSNSITNGSCLLFILFDLQASTSTASLPPLLTPHCPQNFSKAMEEAFSGAAPSDPATSLQSRPHQLP